MSEIKNIILAAGPVIVEEGKVLLNRHGDTNFWKFCGGRVENLDSGLMAAAQREVKEEMGIDIEILDSTPFLLHTVKETETGQQDVILVHYLAKRVGEINPGADIDDWTWLDLNQLSAVDLAPNIEPVLKYFKFI